MCDGPGQRSRGTCRWDDPQCLLSSPERDSPAGLAVLEFRTGSSLCGVCVCSPDSLPSCLLWPPFISTPARWNPTNWFSQPPVKPATLDTQWQADIWKMQPSQYGYRCWEVGWEECTLPLRLHLVFVLSFFACDCVFTTLNGWIDISQLLIIKHYVTSAAYGSWQGQTQYNSLMHLRWPKCITGMETKQVHKHKSKKKRCKKTTVAARYENIYLIIKCTAYRGAKTGDETVLMWRYSLARHCGFYIYFMYILCHKRSSQQFSVYLCLYWADLLRATSAGLEHLPYSDWFVQLSFLSGLHLLCRASLFYLKHI